MTVLNTVAPNTTARDARRWIASASVVAALAISCFGACGSSEGAPVPIDDLARLVAEALCNNIGPCCEQSGFPHDQRECLVLAESQLRGEVANNRSPNIGYDANAARACLDAYTAAVKSCGNDDAIESACRRVFVGTIMPGQTCTSSAECIPGASCHEAEIGGEKRCTDLTTVQRGKLGDACKGTCTDFDDGGSFCSGSARPGDAGASGAASCFTNDGLYCDSMFACAPAPGLSQPCIMGTFCAGDAFCDNGVCAAKRTSGPCGQFNGGCAASAYCDTVTQQCQLRKSTGAACPTGVECLVRDVCTAGVCRAPTIVTAALCRGDL